MRLPPPLALPGSGPDKALLRAPAEAVADEDVFFGFGAQGTRVRGPGGASGGCFLIFPLRLLPFSLVLPVVRLCRWGSGRPSGRSG